jgi:hypothetical protein
MLPYYTLPEAIKDGTYTWKVYANDARNRKSAEAAQAEFSKTSDSVKVTSDNVEYSSSKLVFFWDPVDYAAYYMIEIADDPQFSNIWRGVTYNTTFTPRTIISQVADGEFYWRVAIVDNRNHIGPYTDVEFGTEKNRIFLPLVIR